MLKLIKDSYKLFLKNLPFIVVFALPLLVLSALSIYFGNCTPVNNGIIYFTYAALLLLPLVSAATDISIYRRLFHFNIINPLSSLHAFILYLLVQIGIGLVSTAPIFLFRYILNALGLPPFWSLSLAVFINIFVGFAFMARFNVILPLIIQNKIPPLKEFLAYTGRPLSQWLEVAVLIYLPYVILHYLTAACPYVNMTVTTLFMFVFICFNVTYVNNNRLSRVTYRPAEEKAVIRAPRAEEAEKTLPEPVKKPAAKKSAPKKAPRKTSVPKPPTKKPAAKKAPKKTAVPKLKPALAKV